jgi:putative ABC transport system permease protein
MLWYNINQRTSEIGLRQALGASKGAISRQFVYEILFVTAIGVAIGLFFSGQVALVNLFDAGTGIYLLALLLSTLIIFSITALCALLPSRQAAVIQPAIALHES